MNRGRQNPSRALLVEDVDFNRRILTEIFEGMGWQVLGVTSGEAALKVLADDPHFDMILMDIGLPGINGFETTQKIRENPATALLPVIALSADTTLSSKQLRQAGMNATVEKNFDPEQLRLTIKKVLANPPYFSGTPRPTSDAVTPQPVLNVDQLLSTYGSRDNLRLLAEAFFADADKEIDQLQEALAAGNLVAIRAICHNLQGATTIFTALQMKAAAAELSSLVKQGKIGEARDMGLAALLRALEAVRNAVEEALLESPTQSAGLSP